MSLRSKIPNYLTFARLLAVPGALVSMHAWPDDPRFLFGIFVAASLTDFLDGFLARRWNATSPLGALLDPIADKLLVALLLIYLSIYSELPLLTASVIILRELYISGLREFLGRKQITLPVSSGGKLKTALQMIGITLMLAAPVFGISILLVYGTAVLYLAAIFAFTSAAQYTRASWKHLAN